MTCKVLYNGGATMNCVDCPYYDSENERCSALECLADYDDYQED